MTDLEATFSKVYRNNLWNGDESLSGPGSGTAATRNLIPGIVTVAERLKVKSVLNVGCGDDYWFPDLSASYLGVDLVPQALERARGFHPKRKYQSAGPDWPHVDLIVCRDVLQHLSFETGVGLIERMELHGRWLLLSTYLTGKNEDIEDGGFHCPDLSMEPYGLGPPILLLFDGWRYDSGPGYRDTRKFLGLW